MLSEIKDMISKQVQFLEAASTIYEDAVSSNLDDSIILGEEVDESKFKSDTDNDNDTPVIDNDDNEDDVMTSDINVEDEPLPLPGDDTLPTPVGRQTGEPIDNNDNILDVSIDLSSNTIRDTLPIPPANASDAIGSDDDILSQKIDSGFGGNNDDVSVDDNSNDILYQNIETSQSIPKSIDDDKNDNDLLTEAINLGGDDSSDDIPTDDPGASDAPDSDSSDNNDNPVTAAVKDKVSELNEPTDDGIDGSGGSSMTPSKEELLKKLGNITKNIEDAKRAVMDALN